MLDSLISTIADWQHYLATTQVHPLLPFPILDVLGAMRLSIVVDQIARARAIPGENGQPARRSSALQEAFGILVVVFGGETFLACCTGTTPSWLLSPAVGLLFAGMHLLLTRTPLSAFVPKRPSLAVELPLAFFDALGRSLLLTTATLLPLTLHTSPLKSLNPLSSTKLYNNATAMLLGPFISTTPFPVLIFGWDWFTPSPKLQTPPELRAGGWMTVDFWAPTFIGTLYAFLINAHPAFQAPYQLLSHAIRHSSRLTALLMDRFGPHGAQELPQWVMGHEAWEPRDATALCCVVLTELFGLRAIYNFGGNSWITGKPLASRTVATKGKVVKTSEKEVKARDSSARSSGIAAQTASSAIRRTVQARK